MPVNPVLLRPIPTSEQLNSVCVQNSNVAFACGRSGVVLRRLNNNSDWEYCNSSTDKDLNGIHFSDKYNGIAVGKNGTVIRTTDSGNNWIQCRSKTLKELFEIAFMKNGNAVACGLGGTILKSSNSGIIWKKIVTGTIDPFFCLDFFDEQFGCAGSFNSVYLTSDSGITWTKEQFEFSPPAQITGICIIDTSVIYASSNSPSGRFIRSFDGGENWNSVSLDLPLLFGGAVDLVTDLDFTSRQSGTIVTAFGTILTTVDEGNTWTRDTTFRATIEKPFVMTDISQSSGLISICGGGGTVFESDNSGTSWKISVGGLGKIESAFFCSASIGYMGGEGSHIYKTTDSGLSWHPAGNTTSEQISSVLFTNPVTGLAATKSGIERTTNGGVDWMVSYKSGYKFRALSHSGSSVFASGGLEENGISLIICSQNSGESWSEVFSGTEGFVTNISGTSDGFISASTSYGRVLLSSDMGVSWNITFATDEAVNSVKFRNKMTGFAGSADGIVIRTTNGGITWDSRFTGSSKDVFSICLQNDNVIAAGEGGFVFASEDDGMSWHTLEKSGSNNINSMLTLNEESVWCFGDFGTVIKYETSEKIFSDASIAETKFIRVSAKPNPVTDKTIVITESAIESINDYTIELYDVSGRKVNVGSTSHLFNSKIISRLNVNELISGIYFCRLRAGSETAVVKLLKIR